MNDTAALQVLGLRAGATPVDVRRAYLREAGRHHPDKGGDATLFRRAASAYHHLNGAGSAPETPEALHQRVTREDAPSSWNRGSRSTSKTLALEADPQLEAAFRYAAGARKHQDVMRQHPGYTFDASGDECGPNCLTSVRAEGKAVLCDAHKRVHTCAPDVCCAHDRGCTMTILCLANQWRRSAQRGGNAQLLSGHALERHVCGSTTCRWIELSALRDPKEPRARGQPMRRQVFVCAATGRPHICTASQCRAGVETQVVDERGALARQFKCSISQLPLGPMMPWVDGVTQPLGTDPVMRLENGGDGKGRLPGPNNAAKTARPAADVRTRLLGAVGIKKAKSNVGR